MTTTTEFLKSRDQFITRAEVLPGSWKLQANNTWNIPAANEVRFEIKQLNNFHGTILSIRALVIDNEGRILGVRTMNNPREEGYCQVGRVSLFGRKVRGWTSSQLFEREDGSLCSVAVIRV